MICSKCGSNVEDGAVFCPTCGKLIKGDTVGVNQQNGYPLSNFTAKLFTLYFEIVLWVILLVGIIAGGIIGSLFHSTFLGIIIGGAASFIQIILIGGLVSLFIKLVNNSEEIKKKIKE